MATVPRCVALPVVYAVMSVLVCGALGMLPPGTRFDLFRGVAAEEQAEAEAPPRKKKLSIKVSACAGCKT